MNTFDRTASAERRLIYRVAGGWLRVLLAAGASRRRTRSRACLPACLRRSSSVCSCPRAVSRSCPPACRTAGHVGLQVGRSVPSHVGGEHLSLDCETLSLSGVNRCPDAPSFCLRPRVCERGHRRALQRRDRPAAPVAAPRARRHPRRSAESVRVMRPADRARGTRRARSAIGLHLRYRATRVAVRRSPMTPVTATVAGEPEPRGFMEPACL